MQKKNAGLDEMFRLYILSRSLPAIRALLADMLQGFEYEADMAQGETAESRTKKSNTVRRWFVDALDRMSDKFNLYQRFVEQLLDMSKLPALEIDPAHDPALKELRDERDQLYFDAQSLLREAQSGYASFATVSLDTDPRNKSHGMVFRTTKGEDERILRANRKDVRIVSILKNGLHFSTPQLERISERYHNADEEYRSKQQAVVAAAMETALTYLPLAEAASELVAELDVLLGFATTAS